MLLPPIPDDYVLPFVVSIGVLLGTIISFLLMSRSVNKSNKGESLMGIDISMGLRKEERTSKASGSSADDRVLNPAVFKQFSILKVTRISHDTKLLRFEIPFGRDIGLAIGRHITLRTAIDGNYVMRPYTPVSRPDQKGYFDLLVKYYEFGKMTPFLHSLKAGSTIEVRGPVGRFKYTSNMYSKMGLIAGGTGLTPCLQVMRSILEGRDYEDDTTTFVLFFQNRTEADILLRGQIDELCDKYSDRVVVKYFLSNAQTNEFAAKGHINERRGYISIDDVQACMNPAACQFVGICGPSGFNNTMKKLLVSVGHTEDGSIYTW